MRPAICGSNAKVELPGAAGGAVNPQFSPRSTLRKTRAFSWSATASPDVETGSYSTHHEGLKVTRFQVAPASTESFTPTLVEASTRSGFDGITE